MDAETLAGEIAQIAGMVEIEREPAIDALWKRCTAAGYVQRKPVLRELVKATANAPQEAERHDAAQQMLDEFFLLNVKGKVRIGTFTSEQVNGHSRRILNLMTRADFTTWTEDRPEAELWLRDPAKRKYTGLITDPDKPAEHDGKLNLWAGFGIGPVAGDAAPFVAYVHTILAQQQEAWRDYILNWLAWVLQNPGERIGVVLCLVSAKEGTGKGTIGNLLLTIFGQHGSTVADPEALTGHFNAHLADALYVFADEAMFSGDLRGADRFKNRVTEPWVSITPKGVDSIQMENRVSYLMATNHRFAASVSYTDRRFAMFEVSEVPQSRQYWDGLHQWIASGGKSVVLDFLLRRDLTGFHPVDSRPLTPIYLDTRKQSLRGSHHWWHEVLENESFGADAKGMPQVVLMPGSNEVDKSRIYAAYKHWHKDTQHKAERPVSQQWFWRDFYAMTEGAVRQLRPGGRGEQVRAVSFPMADNYPDWVKLLEAFEQWLSQ